MHKKKGEKIKFTEEIRNESPVRFPETTHFSFSFYT